MKNWQFGIGEWAVVNGTMMKSVPGLVGKLVYIKELLTSGTYDYRVFDGDSEYTNVKEEELNKVPNSKLDTYLKFAECKKAKVKLYGGIVDVLNINFNTEMVRVTNEKGLELMFMLSELEPVELSFIDELDEDVSEETVDMVNSPNHYTSGGIESIDYMKAKLSTEAFQGFLHGNVLKYISRSNYKNGLEDLKKAQWYLNKLVSEIQE